MGITKENARHFAAFILYGARGAIYSDLGDETEESKDSQNAYKIIEEIFY